MPKLTKAQLVEALKNPVKKSKRPEKSEEKKALDRAGEGLGAASKLWSDRFKVMNDSEFWFCIVWRSEEDLEAFAEKLELPTRDGRFVDGRELLESLGIDPEAEEPEKAKIRKAKIRKMTKEEAARRAKYQDHPLPDWEDGTGKLHEIIDFESPRLLDVEQDSEWLATHGDTIDYPHWLCFWFVNREAKFKALRQSDLIDVGDKYLDGYMAAELLFPE